jgi:hypothetical protein
MTHLVRFYIRHVAIGFVLAAVFTGLLLWFNVANLWHLVTHAPGGGLAVVLLVVFNGVVFSGVQFGIAIMSLAEDDAGDRGPDRAVPGREGLSRHPVPIPVHHDRAARRDYPLR